VPEKPAQILKGRAEKDQAALVLPERDIITSPYRQDPRTHPVRICRCQPEGPVNTFDKTKMKN
jgi:hypothetical protein